MDSRNRHDHLMSDRPQTFQALSRQLLGDVQIVAVNSAEHCDQERNQHDYDPRAMNEFGDDQDDEDDASGDGAKAINYY